MSVEITADEMFGSLTGFDELAITKHFGAAVHQLHPDAGGSPFTFLRALVFVHRRRNDASDRDAYKQAMDLPVHDLTGYFADAEEDLDPDDPDTEAGKGDSPSV